MLDPVDIETWRRVDARVTTSAQPTEAQLEALARLGVTHIINLGLHEHQRALPDEARSVARLGMTYIHIPVAFDNPTDEDFKRFCDALSGLQNTRVHVHCIANLRVTAFFYRYQRDVLGIDEAHARALMDSVWRPGGVWARFIGDAESEGLSHRPPEPT